jgi:6-phosphogluconolactonase
VSEGDFVVRAVAGPGEATRLVAARLEELISEAIAHCGVAHVALAGGNTPRPAYELLAERLGGDEPVRFWFGDERAVGPGDPESNFGMVAQTGLPTSAIRRIEGERGAEDAAEAYAQDLREHLPVEDGQPVLDTVLLGLGEDGHTASLFPGNAALEARGVCAAVHDAPKPPPERITLTVPMLRAARHQILLVAGADKAKPVATLLRGDDDRQPATMVAKPGTELIADSAALAAHR